jgi:hypothetical protein
MILQKTSRPERLFGVHRSRKRVQEYHRPFLLSSVTCGVRQQRRSLAIINQVLANSLVFPLLTEEEKHSPIGTSTGCLMGLSFTHKQQLAIQRKQQAAEAQPVAAVYQFFVQGTAPPNTALVAAQPSTRINLEENAMMKWKMQFQTEFQNKTMALRCTLYMHSILYNSQLITQFSNELQNFLMSLSEACLPT